MGILDTENRTYTCDDGAVFHLKPLPVLVVERLKNDQWGKPQPPIVEVTIGKNGKRKEANPLDPDYQAALAEWETAKNRKLMIYGFTKGIEEEPDESAIEEWRRLLPGVTPNEAKYLWVVEHITNIQEIQTFFEAIMSQTLATEVGLEAAAAGFPGES